MLARTCSQSRIRAGRNFIRASPLLELGRSRPARRDVGHGGPRELAQLFRRLGGHHSRAVLGGRYGGWIVAGDSGFARRGIPFLGLVLGGRRKSDGPWGAGEQVIKLNFFRRMARLLHAATSTLPAGVVRHGRAAMSGLAPTNTDWVRAVILARDISYDGALQLDDLKLEILPTLNAPVIQQVNTLNTSPASFNGTRWHKPAVTWSMSPRAGPSGRKAGASDLFISEYGEGTGNERYVEIWNGSGGLGGPHPLSPVGHQRGRQLV